MPARKTRVPRRLFEETFAKSRVVNSDFFTFRMHQPATRQRRMTVVVSSKVAKRAVDRNKLRRRVYQLLDRSIPQSTSLIVLCFAKKGAPALDFKTLKTQIETSTQQLLK